MSPAETKTIGVTVKGDVARALAVAAERAAVRPGTYVRIALTKDLRQSGLLKAAGK